MDEIENDETVMLRSYRYRFEADIDRVVLEEAGIQSVLVGDDAGGWRPEIISDHPIRLYVLAGAAEAAEEALASVGGPLEDEVGLDSEPELDDEES